MKFDTDSWDFYPLKNGTIPPSSLALRPLAQAEDGKIPAPTDRFFLLDGNYGMYKEVRDAGRKERLGKYYRCLDQDMDMKPIIRFILDKMKETSMFAVHSFPVGSDTPRGTTVFNRITRELIHLNSDLELSKEARKLYYDTFDALASQLQSDLVVVHRRPDGTDYVSHIHLFFPNGWSAETHIGQSFADIHDGVTNSEGRLLIQNPSKMVAGMVGLRKPVERVGAISFRRAPNLNRHPSLDEPADWDFNGRDELYLRYERQTVMGVPESNCFVFCIHTLLANLAADNRREAAIKAISSGNPEAYHREDLSEHGEKFLEYLRSF